MANIKSAYKVSAGYLDEKGYVRVKKSLVSLPAEQLEEEAKRLEGYLLKFDLTVTSSYDSSDDDRVEDSYDRYDRTVYGKIDLYEDSEAYLLMDGEIKGIVFRVKPNRGNEIESHVFFFDGSVAQSASLGYSASHSSRYTYVNEVTLAKKRENGAPEEGRDIRFEQHEMYPSF